MWGVEKQDAEEAVGDVGRQVEVAIVDLLFAVALSGADGGVAVALQGEVDGVLEEGAALDVVVADELEGIALGEDGGVVIERTIAKAEKEARGDAVARGYLGVFTVAEEASGLGADGEEAAHGSLGVVDGHGSGKGEGGEAEERDGAVERAGEVQGFLQGSAAADVFLV